MNQRQMSPELLAAIDRVEAAGRAVEDARAAYEHETKELPRGPSSLAELESMSAEDVKAVWRSILLSNANFERVSKPYHAALDALILAREIAKRLFSDEFMPPVSGK